MGAAWRASSSSSSGTVRPLGVEFRALLVWIIIVVWVAVDGVQVQAQSVEFSVTPAAYSSDASPTFAFSVVPDAGGVDPCASSQCSFQCKVRF